MHVLSIVGCLSSEQYHEARLIAEDIVTAAANTATPLSLHLRPLIHYQWQSYLRSHPVRSSSASSLPSMEPCVVHSAYGRLGGIDELVQWAAKQYQYEDARTQRSAVDIRAYRSALQRLAREELAGYITRQQQQHNGYQYAYLDFEVDGRHTASPTPHRHRLVIELYPHIAPRTTHNFLQLSHPTPRHTLPDPAAAPADLPVLHYLHSPIHRVVPSSYMQCGDIYHGRGDFSLSSHGTPLADESYALSHEAAGVVSMVGKAGEAHSGGSQFLVTLGAARHFDGRYVAFGRVVDGLQLLVQCNNSVSVGVNGGSVVARDGLVLKYERPLYPVTIAACDEFTTELLSDSFSSWTQQPTVPSSAPSAAAVGTPSRAITLLVIGPHASGKTSLVQTWCSSSPATPPSPTTGFELDTLTYHVPAAASSSSSTYQLSFYGLGGAVNIRGYWSSYYDSAHAVVYVVDADNTDAAYWSDTAQQYSAMAAHPLTANKPVLVLANRRTATEAAPAAVAGLQQLAAGIAGDEQARVVHGSVVGDAGGEVRAALGWLVGRVDGLYDELDGRVKADVEERKRQMREERERRREQLAREKEEREQADERARRADECEQGWNAMAVSGPSTARESGGNDESAAKPVEEEKTAA